MDYKSIKVYPTPDRHATPNCGTLFFSNIIDFSKISPKLLELPEGFGPLFWFAVLEEVIPTVDSLDVNFYNYVKPPLQAVWRGQNCFIADIQYLKGSQRFAITYVLSNKDNEETDFSYNSSNGVLKCNVLPKPVIVAESAFIDCINSGKLSDIFSFFHKEGIFEQNENYINDFKDPIKNKYFPSEEYIRLDHHTHDKKRKFFLEALVKRIEKATRVSPLGIQRFVGQVYLKFTIPATLERELGNATGLTVSTARRNFILIETICIVVNEAAQNLAKNSFDNNTLIVPEAYYDPFSKALLEISNQVASSKFSSLFTEPYRDMSITIPRIIASLECSIFDKYALWLCLYEPLRPLYNKETSKPFLSADSSKSLYDTYFPAVVIALQSIFSPAPFVTRDRISEIPEEQRITVAMSIDPEIKIFTTTLAPNYADYDDAFDTLRNNENLWMNELSKSKNIITSQKEQCFQRLREEIHKDDPIKNVLLNKEFLKGQLILEEDRTKDWLYNVSLEPWLNLIDRHMRDYASFHGLTQFLRDKGKILLERLELPVNQNDELKLDFRLIFPKGKNLFWSLYASKDELANYRNGRFKLKKPIVLDDIGTLSIDAELEHRIRRDEHHRRAEMRTLEIPQAPVKLREFYEVLNNKIIDYLYPPADKQAPGIIEMGINFVTFRAYWASEQKVKNIAASIQDLKFCSGIHNIFGPVQIFCLELIFLNPEANAADLAHILAALRSFIGTNLTLINIIYNILKYSVETPIELDYQDPPLLDFYFWLNTQVESQIKNNQANPYYQKFEKKILYKTPSKEKWLDGKGPGTQVQIEQSNLEVWQNMLIFLNKNTFKLNERKLILQTLRSGTFRRIFSSDGPGNNNVETIIDASIAKLEASRSAPPVVMAPLVTYSGEKKPKLIVEQAVVDRQRVEAKVLHESIEKLRSEQEKLNIQLGDFYEKIQKLNQNLIDYNTGYKHLTSEISNLATKYKVESIFPKFEMMPSRQAIVGQFPDSTVVFNHQHFDFIVADYQEQCRDLNFVPVPVDNTISITSQSTLLKKSMQENIANELRLKNLLAKVQPALNDIQPKLERFIVYAESLKKTNNDLREQYDAMIQHDKEAANFYQKRAKALIKKVRDFRNDEFYDSFFTYAKLEIGGQRGRQFAFTLENLNKVQHNELYSKDVNRFNWLSRDWKFLDWAFGKRTTKARLLKIYNAYENVYQQAAKDLPALLDESDNTSFENIKTEADLLALQNKLLDIVNAEYLALANLTNTKEKWFSRNRYIKTSLSTLDNNKNTISNNSNELKAAMQQIMRNNVDLARKATDAHNEQWMKVYKAATAETQNNQLDLKVKSSVTQYLLRI